MAAFSVIVSTYNRCDKLVHSLRAIERAAAPDGVAVEIVVVDNNSRDATKAVVEQFAATSAVPTRYAFETAQGLSFARNRGIREATGAILACTDDDCIADPDWIANIWREFAADPDLGIVGGRVDLYSPDDRPVSIRTVSERVRYVDPIQIYSLIMGANLAFRRTVVERIGGFDPAFGGTRGATADDIDFIYRAMRAGFGVAFVPEIRVRHDHGRSRDDEIAALNRGYLKGRSGFYFKHALKGDREIMRHAYWEIVNTARAGGAKQLLATLGTMAAGVAHVILTRTGLVRF